MKASDFDLELEELRRRSVDRLLMADVLDLAAFNALYSYLCEKATLIKQEHVLSKQVLSVLLDAQQAIESRAQYDAVVRQHKSLIPKFATLLGLIAHGEDCRDRQPGVPRIS
jgi:hypothetical protein